jgi:hypothetical protein
LEEWDWMTALSSGRLYERRKDAVGFQPTFRSGSKADLAKDDKIPEGLFRVIVRRRYARMAKEGKQKFLFGTHEIAPEGLGGFKTKGLFKDVAQLRNGSFFDLRRLVPGDLVGIELLSYAAESGAEIDEAIAEGVDTGVFLGLGDVRRGRRQFKQHMTYTIFRHPKI